MSLYKLLYKVYTQHKNCGRIGRKPIPKELREKVEASERGVKRLR